ncbi:MAG: mevalonate kinase family protein [Bacteriovoracaceae bacterium]
MSYPSKILLFGEYSIILNSNALSIPYPYFEGKLKFHEKRHFIDPELKAFGQFLKRIIQKNELNCTIDVQSFLFDIGRGLTFDSTIPQGFGVGSSGALVASVYERYVEEKTENIEELKQIFSKLESHFHGSSSGVDPLISYLNCPIFLEKGKNVQKIEIPGKSEKSNLVMFLLNTHRARKTEPLVNLFLEKCKARDFTNLCNDVLIPTTNSCIENFLNQNTGMLLNSFKELSEFQLKNFSQMVPKLFHDVWCHGIDTDSFYLKLCGAGGGGFILGLGPENVLADDVFNEYDVKTILRI